MIISASKEGYRQRAVQSLFEHLLEICEGSIMVDREARIVWIDDKYRALLGIGADALGHPVEEIIPSSLMRQVVETGEPILLDLMPFGDRSFVVIRIPLKDDGGAVIGGIGFVLFDRAQYLKPLVQKFASLQTELEQTQRELAGVRSAKYTLAQLLGTSPPMREVKRMVRRAAQIDSTVLLLGETGTGKEMVAHAIHAASPRANRPMVAVNVAAIPDTLTEAEFFGVAPGAYTGADRRGRPGKFQVADGGTLFLDEIGDMPLALQAKLLRVLQDREIEPIGSNRVVKVDVRIIAATSRNLDELVEKKLFRADLFYRLNVVTICLPPLRDRLGDLEAIAESILERLARKFGSPLRGLAPSAVAALSAHRWPGNVRELYNTLERLCALTDSDLIAEDDVVTVLPSVRAALAEPSAAGVAAAEPGAGPGALPRRPPIRLAEAVAEAERTAIIAALAEAGGVKAEAAKLLGISRGSLYDKLVTHGIASDSTT